MSMKRSVGIRHPTEDAAVRLQRNDYTQRALCSSLQRTSCPTAHIRQSRGVDVPIECQKSGLPHAHAFLTLAQPCLTISSASSAHGKASMDEEVFVGSAVGSILWKQHWQNMDKRQSTFLTFHARSTPPPSR